MTSIDILEEIKEVAFINKGLITELREGYIIEDASKSKKLKELFEKLNSLLNTQKQIEHEQFVVVTEVLAALQSFDNVADWVQDLYQELVDIILANIPKKVV